MLVSLMLPLFMLRMLLMLLMLLRLLVLLELLAVLMVRYLSYLCCATLLCFPVPVLLRLHTLVPCAACARVGVPVTNGDSLERKSKSWVRGVPCKRLFSYYYGAQRPNASMHGSNIYSSLH